ncbi:serine hydrolase domain-containing protein [Kytococcus sedentarius]|uniref:serine hydrolase domain-containing protein n=1 Tax=Kytococcus sedentarius TaxID=1276 RepID=UPI0035BC67B3
MSALTDRVQRAIDEGSIPGAVTLVARGGDVHAEAQGTVSFGGPPMPQDAIFRIMSMTKPVLTVATLRLVQDGRLDLDDPVERWLPELAERTVLRTPTAGLDEVEPARHPITVRHLLTNGSGYGMELGDTPIARGYEEIGMAPGPEPISPGADAWLSRLATLPLTHQPGEGFRYHHSFSLLGVLLQHVAGVPRQELLEREVLGPLGMVDTGERVPPEHTHRLPAAYTWRGEELVELEPAGGGFHVGPAPYDTAHGELVSTAADYLHFARMLANGGRVDGEIFVDPALVEQMVSDQTPAVAKTPESFFPGFWDATGWGWGGAVELSGDHAGRYGWSGGLGTDFFVDPDGTLGILLTQVEMGERTMPLVGDFQRLAGR